MKNHRILKFIVGAAAVCVIGDSFLWGQAAERKPAFPEWVNWSDSEAYRRDNGCRGELILNAVWRWQPAVKNERPNPAEWYYRNVPGWLSSEFYVRDEAKNIRKKWGDKAITGEERCWQEREFVIPPSWKGRRIMLDIFCIRGNGVLYLDDEKIADIPDNHPVEITIPEPRKFGIPYKLTLQCEAVMDDVWLRSYPAEASIEDEYLISSFRKKQLILKARGHVGKGGRKTCKLLLCVAEDPQFARIVKKTAVAVTADAGGQWKIEKGIGWEDVKLWSPEHPDLYWYKIELEDGDGRLADATLPKRFGFREVWIEGGDLMLNGNPFRFYNSQISPFGWGSSGRLNRLASKTHRLVRTVIGEWKKINLNGCMVWNPKRHLTPGEPVFETADEMGFMISTQGFPGNIRQGVGEDEAVKAANDLEESRWKDRAARYVRRYRHHPSLLLWISGTGGSQIWDYCPGTLDGSRLPENDWPELVGESIRNYQKVAALWNELDGTRPVTWYSSAAACNPVVSTMGYFGFGMDLQERENWPYAWSKKKARPLWNSEFSMMFEKDWVTRDQRNPSGKNKRRPLYLELGAMYFGEKWYRDETDAHVALLGDVDARTPFQEFDVWRAVQSLITVNNLRAWRTYGISMGIFSEARRWFVPGSIYRYVAEGEDPRRPGATPDEWRRIDEVVGSELNDLGKAAQESLTPLYAYIGGEAHFTRKDHCYSSGEEVVKAVVVINDREADAHLRGEWKLENEKGDAVDRGIIEPFMVWASQRSLKDRLIRFKAPPVDRAGEYRLVLKLTGDIPGRLDDRMAIRVFPPVSAKMTPVQRKVYCFDPQGDTCKLLEKGGIAFRRILSFSEVKGLDGLLVIGRRGLEKDEDRRKLQDGFDHAVAGGLRVIVFEQAMKNLMGMRMEESRPRRAFASAKGHPLVNDLAGTDFWYWRGESDLAEAYPDPLVPFGGKVPPDRSGEKGYPVRLWKWGNDNSVATFVIVKPQLGANRALVSSGFEMMETPLLESVRGRGRILFCQLDVTNRYGTDPVATRVVNRLFAYMDTVDEPDPMAGEPLAAGEKGTGGGRFEGYRATPPEGRLGWGITAADLFFRQKAELPAIKSANGKPLLIAWETGGKRAVHALSPEKIPGNWQKVKAMRVIAALRINQGGSSGQGPQLRLQDDSEQLYPVEWKENFVHPYDHWRW